MSTLGGSRGERNAKPKFSALDINRMYKNSRGETSETTTQKNQVPRKHGMQSLGKVPSARRPPANLPSLKAETVTTTTPSPTVANNNQIIQPEDGGIQGTNNLKNTNINSNSSLNKNTVSNCANNTLNQNSNQIHNHGNNSNSNSSAVIGGIGSKLINNSITSTSAVGKANIGVVGPNINQTHYNQQNKPVTWSAITTGNDHGGGQRGGGKSSNNAPPLYQSPQFQYEFPTLDGTVGGGANGGYHQSVNRKNGNADHRDHINHQQQQQNLQNQLSTHQQSQSYYQRDIERQGRPQQQHLRHDAHNYKDGSDECGGGGTQLIEEDSRDITEVSLRPQTDAAAWLQQQEKAIKNAATGNDHLMNHQGLVPQNQQQSNASSGALNAAVPLPILALMPPFMQRGVPLPNASNSSGIGLISTSSNYQNGVSKDSTVTSNSMRSQSIRSNVQSSYRSNSPVISGNIRGSNKRFNNSVPSNGMQDAEFSGSLPHTIRKEKEFIIEPEVAQMQRPIIREEDLERLNAIANDDSWTKQDDIDYSKKLTFSDEEESPDEQSPTSEPEKSPSNKNANTIDQRKNSSTSVSSSNGPTSTWQRKDRDTGNEREKSGNNLESVEDLHHRASVPPGAIALDAGVYERVKLRKEEEERRDMERKQAAARKKQELEMKMNSKKAAGDSIDNNSVSVSENQTNNRRSGNRVYDRSLTADRGNRPFDTRDMRTAGGDHIRNMNNIGNGNSNANNSSVATVAGGTNKSVFSTHFQSNLPPRFLRQQQMQSQGSTTMSSGGGSSNSIISRNISVSATGNSGLERSSSTTSTFDNSRYIHKSTQRLGGGTSGGVRNDYRDNYTRNYGRSRNDSDREESYGHVNRTTTGGASGREDHSQHVNSLPRSISDTSQRKISVSSNDESVKQNNTFDSSNKDNTNTNMVSSWAEETNVEMKRQRDESFSSSHSHESIPIKILQRPHTQKSVSEEDNMPAQQQHTKQTQLHQAQNSSRRISESSDNQSVTFAPTQILKRSELNDGKAKSVTSNEESPTTDDVFRTLETQESVEEAKSERPCSNNSVVNEAQSKSNEDECKPQNAAANERKESQATSNSNASFPDTEATIAMPKLEEKARNNSNNGSSHPPKEQKRNNSRGGGSNSGPRERNERNSHSRSYGSGNSYRGNRGGSWKYGGGRYMDSHYVGDSSYGDENECNADHRRSERNPKVQRREMVGGSRRGTNNASLDDRVFTPRGEPSRRGRGAGGNMGDRVSSSSYRRSSNSNTGGGGSRNYGRSNYSGDHKDMQKRISESSDNVNSGIDKAKQSQCTLNSGIAKALEKEQDTTNSTQKQNQSVPPPKAIEQENRSSTIATTSPIFGSNGGGNNQERKENASSVEDDRKCITAGCVDRKTLPKEKDTLGSETPSTTPITTRSNNTMNSCSPSNSQTKNTDMPITTLPLFNQGIAKPMNQQQKSQQQIQLPQTQQSHIITKPPPGLAPTMLKPNNSSSVANIPSTCASGGLQKSTTDMQRSKSDTNNIANLTTAGDKSNKLGSVGDAKGSNSGSVVGGNLILDGAPVNTIIFENTNYKQQAQQAAQIKRSSESIVASSSTVSCGANASAAGSVDTLSTAFSQVSFSNSSSSSNKSTDVTSVQNCGGTRVSPNDYDKDMKLGFTFGDASDSYGSGGTHNIGLISDVENKVSTGNTSVSVTQAQQGVISQHQQQQQQQQQQNIISTADLNMKIASVKKVWETVAPSVTDSSNNSTLQQQHLHQQQQQQAHQQQQMDTVVDPTGHMSAASFVAAAVAASQQQQQQQHMPHYVTAVHMAQHHVLSSPGPASSAYGSHGCSPFDTTQLEQQFAQTASGIVVGGGNVGEDSTIVGYTSPQQSQANMAQQQQQALKQHSSDVVVKQHQQSSASCKQMSGSHHNSSMGMSPPPNLQQQQQQQQQQASVSQQQIHAPQPFYQASPQFSGIPTIPSPPAMVFNSSQMAPPPSQGGLYAPFHSLDHSSRSQFSAAAAAAAAHNFPGHYGAATAAPGGPFNAYPMQTPPNMPTAPTPDMYSNLTSQFRMGGGPSPFGNPSSQQLNNPNAAAVAIISSNSNSLMSTVGSVKPPPSSQQLGTIGSKSAGGSGPYATTTQGYMNLYAAPGPPQHPQAPPGPPPGAHQLQSNSFYSNSAAGPSGPAAFYGGPPPQGGAGAQNYGLAAAAAAAAANLYGSHGGHQGAPPGTGGSSGPPQGPPGAQSQHSMGNFNTQFMNSQLLATAAAMNPFRGSHTPQQQAVAAAYMKSSQQQQNHLQDSMGRQLKSPLGADVSLNLVKQTQSQPSPPHHKNYGNWDLQNQVIQQQAVQQQQTQQTQLNQRSSVGGNNSNINASSRGGPPGMPTAQNAQGRYPAPIQRPTNYPQHPQQQQVQQQIQRSGGVSSNVRQNNSSAAGSASSTNSGQQCPGGNHNSNVGGGSAVSNNGGSGGGGSNTSGSNNVVNPVTSGNQSNQMNKTYFVNNSNNGAGSNRGGNHT